jgi:hypothetical protein
MLAGQTRRILMFVPEQLRKAAAIYEERNKLYGDNYKNWGKVALPLLKEIDVKTESDFSRLGILVQIISKLTRYTENFNRGGHDDSLDDMAVYAMMLKELDALTRNQIDFFGVSK